MSLETCVVCGRTFDPDKETTLYVTAEFTGGGRLTLTVCKNCEGEILELCPTDDGPGRAETGPVQRGGKEGK